MAKTKKLSAEQLNQNPIYPPDKPDQAKNEKKIETSFSTMDESVIKTRIEAITFFNEKNYVRALELFSTVADVDEKSLFYQGVCQYYLKDPENAISSLQSYLDKYGEDFLTLKYISFSFYDNNDLANAREYCLRALALAKDTELESHKKRLDLEINAMDGYGSTIRVHFNIIFSLYEHNEIKEKTIDILEDAYREIGVEIDYYPEKPISVILYNEKNFFDVTRAPGWAGGLFDGKIRIPIKNVSGNSEIFQRVLIHEYVHALIYSITSLCPRWLHEGMAEYFSQNSHPLIGQVVSLPKLDPLFLSANPRHVFIAYAESHAAVTYLIDRYRLFRLKEWLQSMGDGNDPDTAFLQAYLIRFADFLQEWK